MDDKQILFFRYNPPGRPRGICWQAALFDHGDNPPYPLAIAWLSDYRGAPVPMGVVLDFILVPDVLDDDFNQIFRRKGYASVLIDGCRRKFGDDLHLTDAISEAGEGLLRSVEAREARGVGDE